MNRNIFREYDIRGVFGVDLTREAIVTLGRAIGRRLWEAGARRTCVGRDCRLSSDELFGWLAEGLLSSGIDVADLGMVPTPVLYFAVHHFRAPAGVMITGSHNPPDYNGFKVQVGDSTIYGEEIQELWRIAEKGDFVKGAGKLTTLDALTPYREFITGDIRIERADVRFALDCGNGVGGVVAPKIMKELGLDPVELYWTPDGTFPNHHPDPTVPEYLVDLTAAIRERGLELGIAYDGDADRLGVVDSRGRILWGDRLLTIFARAILKEHPGAAILGEVKCSQVLYDDIAARGGRPIMWRTGHSLIKAKIKESGALLGGEMSGHVFFKHRWFGFDDAIYASLRLLELVSRTRGGLEELTADIPEVITTPEIRVDCPDELKFGIIAKVQAAFRARPDVTLIDIDGARVGYPGGGWGLARASNTQPVLVLRFEADTEENLARIRADMESVIAAAKEGSA